MSAPSRATRLAVTITTVMVTPVVLVAAPLLAVAAVAVDVVTGPRRMRHTRFLGMAYSYLLLEVAGIAMAIGLWFATGCGLLMSTKWSRAAHYSVQRWWAQANLRAARQWLGVQIDIEGLDQLDELEGGPVVLAAQHASFFDALLPTVVLAKASNTPARHVLKRELAWDPCLGIYGSRHANHFVEREPAGEGSETSAIEQMAATAGRETLVIFPEGTFYSPERASRVYKRLAQTDPERHDRLHLTRLLPPRAGGILALLRGRPDTAMVFMAHAGFEPFGSLRSILENTPFVKPVQVKLWSVPPLDMPDKPKDQLALVDEYWQTMDDWVATQPV